MACDEEIEQEQNWEHWIEIQGRIENSSNLTIQQLDGKLSSAKILSIELKIILEFQRALFKCKKVNMKYKTEYRITETLFPPSTIKDSIILQLNSF